MNYRGRLLLTATAALVASTVHAQPAYTITDLGTLGGGTSYGFAINASGSVAGQSSLASANPYVDVQHAFSSSGGKLTDLGTLGGTNSEARGINAAGQVTGASAIANSGAQHAFLSTNGVMIDLGTLGGSESIGLGINAAGQVTGRAATFSGSTHAIVATTGGITDLGTLGGTFSTGYAINDAGQVTGFSTLAGEAASRPFLYSNGVMTDVGTLGGDAVGAAINAKGQVAGTSYLAGNIITTDVYKHAFVASGGVLTDLGTLGGHNSNARGINDLGQVVGTSDTDPNVLPGYGIEPFLYSNGVMLDLSKLIDADAGWTLFDAVAINDAGQITGTGLIDHQFHAYVLTPTAAAVPEPATWALLAGGFGAAGVRLRRVKRRATLAWLAG